MFKKSLMLLMMGIFLTGIACTQKDKQNESRTTNNEQRVKEVQVEEKTEAKVLKAPEKPDVDVSKKYVATIKTEKGDIVCDLFAKEAPLSVTNFKNLADSDFYKGLTFHRVVSDFVIQGGDPEGTGAGGPGYTIPAEIGKPHKQGALAWARTGDEVNPERRSSGSQFYITHKATPFLDGGYTVFGQTTSGMDVINKIQQGDRIVDVIVEVK